MNNFVMRDIRTFVKLFDLNVPEYEHFDYYVEQYSRLPRWKDLKNKIKIYQDFESLVEDPYKYKLEKAGQIIDFLKSTRAHNELNDDNLIPDYPTNKNFEYSEGDKYLSIDINLANWVVLKKYDPEFLNELGDTYQSLLEKFDVHPIFFNSKQFRQYIFGNLNPKKQIKAQRVIIEDLIKSISNYSKLNIFCIKHDEVIYKFTDYNDVRNIISPLDQDLFKYKIFTVKRCEDFRINNFYDEFGNFISNELSGCNGNKYFIYLKKYILNEPLDIRDLYFRNDGDLAIWSVDGLKLEL
jgi:hypothetical protein